VNPFPPRHSLEKNDELVRSRHPCAGGNPESAKILKRLDSRFHWNDGIAHFQAFCETIKNDDFVKSRNFIKFFIPAKAGIQLFQSLLDPGFRRGDASRDFLRHHQE
jgi:hypothetical protein